MHTENEICIFSVAFTTFFKNYKQEATHPYNAAHTVYALTVQSMVQMFPSALKDI